MPARYRQKLKGPVNFGIRQQFLINPPSRHSLASILPESQIVLSPLAALARVNFFADFCAALRLMFLIS